MSVLLPAPLPPPLQNSELVARLCELHARMKASKQKGSFRVEFHYQGDGRTMRVRVVEPMTEFEVVESS